MNPKNKECEENYYEAHHNQTDQSQFKLKQQQTP